MIREFVKSSTGKYLKSQFKSRLTFDRLRSEKARSHRIISDLCHLLAACCQLPAVSWNSLCSLPAATGLLPARHPCPASGKKLSGTLWFNSPVW
jgi:hypothetical protein